MFLLGFALLYPAYGPGLFNRVSEDYMEEFITALGSNTKSFINITSDIFTIGVSGIAMYIFFFKRKEVAVTFRLLSNYAYQTTLSELRDKLERLNEYKANEEAHIQEITSVFHEICGQINGHPSLKNKFADYIEKVEKATSGRKPLTEPAKRALVSELRERIRHLNVDSYNEIVGDK